jgi:hypothetical protein
VGKYIIDERIEFPKGLQREFLSHAKEITGLKWHDLANKIGASSGSLRIEWYLERATIPKSCAEKLVEICGDKKSSELFEKGKILCKCWGQKKGILKALKNMKINRIEKISESILKKEEFAEFLGILLGDGHLHEKGVQIVLNKWKEQEYAKYVAKILLNLFGKKPQIRYGGSVIRIILNSTILVDFLKSIGLKTGRKKETARIPELLFENQDLLKKCIRGLVDTDGGIFRKDKKGNRYIVDFKSTTPKLLADARNALEMLGFTVSRSGPFSVRIQTQAEVKQYLKKIGTSNSKNNIAINHILRQ